MNAVESLGVNPRRSKTISPNRGRQALTGIHVLNLKHFIEKDQKFNCVASPWHAQKLQMATALGWNISHVQHLIDELNDPQNPLTEAMLVCGDVHLESLRTHAENIIIGASADLTRHDLEKAMIVAHTNMAGAGPQLSGWFRFYTDASILSALAGINSSNAIQAISTLDRAIIICGPAGGRLDLILSIIESIQDKYFTKHPYTPLSIDIPSRAHNLTTIQSACSFIPVLPTAPSFLAFQVHLINRPFVLRGYAQTWPAMGEHPWRSATYLRFVSGPGRIVPVELGKDYRAHDWGQSMMDWNDFLASLDLVDQPPPPPLTSEIAYLAQHNLMMQFPALQADIIVPDYVYSSPDPPNFPGYHPPGNDDGLVINAWLGPKGTISPAHTDPYFNCFVQVVGTKTVWLAPPEAASKMYSHRLDTGISGSSSPSMANTSRVDVFSMEHDDFPDFSKHVIPIAMSEVLQAGDLLFIPPGWWHAMRGEETSFSVSMWF